MPEPTPSYRIRLERGDESEMKHWKYIVLKFADLDHVVELYPCFSYNQSVQTMNEFESNNMHQYARFSIKDGIYEFIEGRDANRSSKHLEFVIRSFEGWCGGRLASKPGNSGLNISGAEPYYPVRLRSGSESEMMDWQYVVLGLGYSERVVELYPCASYNDSVETLNDFSPDNMQGYARFQVKDGSHAFMDGRDVTVGGYCLEIMKRSFEGWCDGRFDRKAF